jgi:hypothetical protein
MLGLLKSRKGKKLSHAIKYLFIYYNEIDIIISNPSMDGFDIHELVSEFTRLFGKSPI